MHTLTLCGIRRMLSLDDVPNKESLPNLEYFTDCDYFLCELYCNTCFTTSLFYCCDSVFVLSRFCSTVTIDNSMNWLMNCLCLLEEVNEE